MASEQVARFHGAKAAAQAQEGFIARFSRKELPEDIETVALTAPSGGYPICNALKDAGLTGSTSDARRMITQGAVRINGEKLDDLATELAPGSAAIIQVGKRRIARVEIN